MSLPDRDWCKACGLLKPIVNKFYCLCDECNYKRTHGGKTRAEVALERHLAKAKADQARAPRALVRARPGQLGRKRRRALKQRSAKQLERDAAMHATYARIDAEREPVCEGCGRGDVALSHSHLLSQKQRSDLAADADNIRLHCFGSSFSCHEVWERGAPAELVQMDDLRANLRYIESVDEPKHRRILARFQAAGVELP